MLLANSKGFQLSGILTRPQIHGNKNFETIISIGWQAVGVVYLHTVPLSLISPFSRLMIAVLLSLNETEIIRNFCDLIEFKTTPLMSREVNMKGDTPAGSADYSISKLKILSI